MQVIETSAEGLNREFKVVVPAEDIEQRIDTRLSEIGKTIRIPGFRPGKVPKSILRQRYRKSVMGEILEGTVNESAQEAMSDRGIRPALQPKIEVTDFDDGKDLEFTVAVETLPDVTVPDFSDLEIDRPVAEVSEEAVEDSITKIAEQQKQFHPAEEGRAVAEGDQVLIDFEGSIDGEVRDEMSSSDFELEIGSDRLVPGFEEQLVGHKAGETVDVTLTFPEDYPAEDFRGKPAAFTVTIKEARPPKGVSIDDELGKAMGFDDLEGLKEAVRKRTQQEFEQYTRARMKRQLLDRLAERHTFEVPKGMVSLEFETIWKQVQESLKNPDPNDPDKDKPEDQLREEYMAIAERRVRLGLLLAEVGKAANVQVSQEELNRGLINEARRYPGQEQQVIEFFRKNPKAIENLRAPILEEKVVDHILDQVKITETTVSQEELLRDPDETPAVENGEEQPGAGEAVAEDAEKADGEKA